MSNVAKGSKREFNTLSGKLNHKSLAPRFGGVFLCAREKDAMTGAWKVTVHPSDHGRSPRDIVLFKNIFK